MQSVILVLQTNFSKKKSHFHYFIRRDAFAKLHIYVKRLTTIRIKPISTFQ